MTLPRLHGGLYAFDMKNGAFPCPKCEARTGVVESRPIAAKTGDIEERGIWRSRRCKNGHKFETKEMEL